jgi:hypothetical protein
MIKEGDVGVDNHPEKVAKKDRCKDGILNCHIASGH